MTRRVLLPVPRVQSDPKGRVRVMSRVLNFPGRIFFPTGPLGFSFNLGAHAGILCDMHGVEPVAL